MKSLHNVNARTRGDVLQMSQALITIEEFWLGRNVAYKAELTPEIEVNAAETVRRANLLLETYLP